MKELVPGTSNKALGALVGTAGVSFVATRHFAASWFTDEDTGEDTDNANYYRAAACAAMGAAVGMALKKKAPNVAKGAALGGFVAGAVYLAEEWELDDKLSEWFDDGESDDTASGSGEERSGGGVYGPGSRAMRRAA